MSKNMKNNKLHSVILIAIIFISISAVIIPAELNNLDEIWNFNFAKNISDGKVPYRDFNIVTTPLLSMICGFILKIVAKELIVTRILAVTLNTAIFFVIFKILEKLKINRYFNYLILFLIYITTMEHLSLDYNFAILLVILIIILLEMKRVSNAEDSLKYNFKSDFLVGILAGTAILFKQSTGLAVAFIYAFYKIIFIIKKEDINRCIKIILTRMLGICVPIILFIAYLLINNAWEDFLDYAVFGIKTFNNKLSYVWLFNSFGTRISILSILLPLSIIYTFFKMATKEQKTIEDIYGTIICAFSVASFVAVFPISDPMHFLVGGMPAMILLASVVYSYGKKTSQKLKIYAKEYLKILTKCLGAVLLIICSAEMCNYIMECNNHKDFQHFSYIRVNLDGINEVSEYILEKENKGIKVYVLDALSPIYTIPINRYNKNYDMFLKGALGSRGEEGQIENLENEEGIQVLVRRDEGAINWQAPENVIKHIKENWIKVGEKHIFDIYEKQNI